MFIYSLLMIIIKLSRDINNTNDANKYTNDANYANKFR